MVVFYMAMQADGSVVFLSFMMGTPLLSSSLILDTWDDNELTTDLLIIVLLMSKLMFPEQ